MFCWAEAENSIKMRGGKNLPLAQSRRSRCSGSLLACFTKTGPRETWRFLKTKRYKTFLKKVQQQIQTTLVSEKRREDKKEQIPKKNEEKRSKTSLILNFSYHACSRKNGPKLKSQIMSIGEPDWCFNFLVAKVLSIFGQDRWLTSSWLHLSQRKFWCTSYLGKAFVATIRFYLFVCVNVWPGRYHFSWAENLVIDEGQSPQNKIGLCRPCANLGDRSCFFHSDPKPIRFQALFCLATTHCQSV